MINVTTTFLPEISEFVKNLEQSWSERWITNRGKLVLKLEEELKRFLEVESLILMNNGTIPLQIAVKQFGQSGEIITTPFSYVATLSSILWQNCIPKFVDIHPEYLTIDESKIEEAITEKTTMILATHVFGNPCNVIEIERIAKKYGLLVVYDAAHCFGVKYDNKSLLKYGDLSTISFHATKVFHTAEGGAAIVNNKELFDKIYYSHNFGHISATEFFTIGVNGKISELNAAMGLSVLPHMNKILKYREQVVNYYLKNINFNEIRTFKIREKTEWNYSYFPLIFNSEIELLKVVDLLNKEKIFPRRYFYPSLNKLVKLDDSFMKVSEKISSTILCLPLSHDIKTFDLNRITNIINKNI